MVSVHSLWKGWVLTLSWNSPNFRGVPTEDLLTTPAAAKRLGVSGETLRRWADERKIRHVRLPSGQLRFDPADLDAVLVPVEPEPGEVA